MTASCTRDYAGGMQMLRTFWTAAIELDPSAPDEGRVMPYCTEDELAALWARNGLVEVETGAIDVTSGCADFEDYWIPFTLGADQAGRTAPRWTPGGNNGCGPAAFAGSVLRTDRSPLRLAPLPCGAVGRSSRRPWRP
jgi:hypothetical protein